MKRIQLFTVLTCLAGSGIATSQTPDPVNWDQFVSYGGPVQAGRVQLRSLLSRPNFEQAMRRADRINRWFVLRFGHVDLQTVIWEVQPTDLEYISEISDRQAYRFRFASGLNITINQPSGHVRSMAVPYFMGQESERLRTAYPESLPDASFRAIAEELAAMADLPRQGLDYQFSTYDHRENDRMVTFTGCLQGTRFHLGSGFEGRFHETTGIPEFVLFSYEIWSYEPPVLPLITDQEAYNLALPSILQHVTWPSYRVFVQKPTFSIPEYRERQITRSARHAALTAAGKRCLVTTVVVAPVTGREELSEWVAITFDSQTRELLTIYRQPGGMSGSSAMPLQNSLNPRQMIALPDLQLQIPVVPVHGAKPPAPGQSMQTVIRQGRIAFTADLDVEQRVLWIEGKPYRATRAFTQHLVKRFGSPKPLAHTKKP